VPGGSSWMVAKARNSQATLVSRQQRHPDLGCCQGGREDAALTAARPTEEREANTAALPWGDHEHAPNSIMGRGHFGYQKPGIASNATVLERPARLAPRADSMSS